MIHVQALRNQYAVEILNLSLATTEEQKVATALTIAHTKGKLEAFSELLQDSMSNYLHDEENSHG